MVMKFVFRFTETTDLHPDGLLAPFQAWLSEEELSKLARLQRVEDKRDYLAAHALLRRSISDLTGTREDRLQFAADRLGKPYLHDGGVVFSLTHCRGLVACAVARENSISGIGVDAEPLKSSTKLESMIDSFADHLEREWLREQDRPAALVELWTAKEAVLKARGTGLATPDGRDALKMVHCESETEGAGDDACFVVEDEYAIRCRRLASGHVLTLAVSPTRSDVVGLAPEEYGLCRSESPE